MLLNIQSNYSLPQNYLAFKAGNNKRKIHVSNPQNIESEAQKILAIDPSKVNPEAYRATYMTYPYKIGPYIKLSSKYPDLYHNVEAKARKLVIVDGKNYVIVDQGTAHTNTNLFRIFQVLNNGAKSLIASIMDLQGKGYILYNNQGDQVASQEPVKDVPAFFVEDPVMQGYAPYIKQVNPINKVDKPLHDAILHYPAGIKKLNPEGPFGSWHVDFINNFAEFIQKIMKLCNGTDVSVDTILNADKNPEMAFYSLTPEAIKKSGLLKPEVLELVDGNVLKINSELFEGVVPLFDKKLPAISEAKEVFDVNYKARSIPIPQILSEPDVVFLKAISKFLTALNRLAKPKMQLPNTCAMLKACIK